MRKLFMVFVLVFAMIVQDVFSVAKAVDNNESILSHIEYTCVAKVQDKLYFLGENLYAYDAIDGCIIEQRTDLALPDANTHDLLLVNGGNELYALNKANGFLYKLSDEEILPFKQFDCDVFSGNTDPFEERHFMMPTIAQTSDGERLYLLISKEDSPTEYDLYFFDFLTGTSGIVNVENIINVTNYQPDKIVVTIEKTDLYQIVEIDTTTNKIASVLYEEERPRYRITGLAYDQNTDKLIVVTGRGIYQIINHAMIDMYIYLPSIDERIISMDFNCILDGMFVFINQGIFFTSDLDSESASKSLKFANSGLDENVRGFMRENPMVKVSFNAGMVWNNKEIVDSLLTQNSDVDIVKVYAGPGLSAIKNKKYYADLSSSKILSDSISLMYPQIRDILLDDGGILAYPTEMTVYCWSVDERALQQYGYNVHESTMQDWIAFVEEVANDFDVYDSPYTLFPEGFTKRDLLWNFLMQYVVEYEAVGQLHFNTPELKDMLERILKLPNAIFIESNTEAGQIDAYDEGTPPLFTVNTSLSPFEHIWFFENYEPEFVTAPVFNSKHSPVVRSALCVYFVNPYSRNKETAIEFLEYCAQQSEPTLRCFVEQDYDEPIPDQEFIEFYKRTAAAIEDLTNRLETVEVVDHAEIKTNIENQKIALEYAKKHRWILSEEDLAAYKQMAPNITFIPFSLCFTDSSFSVTTIGLSEMIDSILTNNTNLGRVLAEADRKYNMILVED